MGNIQKTMFQKMANRMLAAPEAQAKISQVMKNNPVLSRVVPNSQQRFEIRPSIHSQESQPSSKNSFMVHGLSKALERTTGLKTIPYAGGLAVANPNVGAFLLERKMQYPHIPWPQLLEEARYIEEQEEPQFKRGGHVGFTKTLERARQMGQGDDKILAHIHPIEAAELARKYGGDINPHTGLPQYGKLIGRRGIGKFIRGVTKPLAKLAHSSFGKKVIRPALSVAGHMIAGPAGAAVGGGLGRSLTSKGNFVKNFGRGAKGAAIYSSLASMAGGPMNSPFLQGGHGFMGFQGPQSGFSGRIFGRGPGSITSGLNNFGSSAWNGASNMFGGGSQMPGGGGAGRMAAMNSLQGIGQGGQQQGYAGGDQGNGGGFMSSLGGGLNTALLGAGLAGTMMRRERVTPQQISEEREELERLRNAQTGDITTGYGKWGHEYQPRRVKAAKRKYVNPGHTSGEPIFFDEVNPETEYMAAGGYVSGNSGGAQDNRRTQIPEGSYVMNSTDLSLLGDGNSNKGAEEIAEMERRFLQSGLTRNHGIYEAIENPRYIDAHLSDGEYVIDPRVVSAIGKGNNQRGAKIIEKGRRKLRQEKGMKHILPPKSKPIMSYLR